MCRVRKACQNAVNQALEALKVIGMVLRGCKNACFLHVEQETHLKIQSGWLSAKNAFSAISQ